MIADSDTKVKRAAKKEVVMLNIELKIAGREIPIDTPDKLKAAGELMIDAAALLSGATISTTGATSPASTIATPTHNGNGHSAQAPIARPLNNAQRTMNDWIALAWDELGRPSDGATGGEFLTAAQRLGFKSTAKKPVSAFTASVRLHEYTEQAGFDGMAVRWRITDTPRPKRKREVEQNTFDMSRPISEDEAARSTDLHE